LPAIGRFRPGEIGSRGICWFLSIRTISVVNDLTKVISAMVVVAVVVTSGSAVASVAPAIQGNKCFEVGSIRTFKKVSYICTASGKKKVWQTASSAPGTAATTTTAASTTTDCNVRTTASGKATGANESMPGGNRVRAATSSDGITWS